VGICWENPDVVGILSHWGTLLGIPPAEAAHLTARDAWAQAVRTVIGTRQDNLPESRVIMRWRNPNKR
jgi:hypothetical protein